MIVCMYSCGFVLLLGWKQPLTEIQIYGCVPQPPRAETCKINGRTGGHKGVLRAPLKVYAIFSIAIDIFATNINSITNATTRPLPGLPEQPAGGRFLVNSGGVLYIPARRTGGHKVAGCPFGGIPLWLRVLWYWARRWG